ncbi:MAG: succinate dehydrogenase [Acidobacteria bacterium]|nr:succinate dehydrogenase [Acidobacteriota bacterium]
MASVDLIWKNGRFGQTSRRDAWWGESLLVFLGLGAFIVYGTWAAFQGNHYTHGPYLSPFYSPEIFGDSAHSWFGPKPAWFPDWMPFSPALLILWAPGLFRFTCYYYRGAYYKAFWADPPACAVGEPRNTYLGEKTLPLVLHNLHRYVFYIALLFIVVLGWDAIKATQFDDGFGVGLGTVILTVNACLLSCYTLGCHCSRHLCGGGLDVVSDSPIRHALYQFTSKLNGNHKKFAWASLISVGFADIYVRLCSMGIFTDVRFF